MDIDKRRPRERPEQRAARHGRTLTRIYRDDLGWAYLLAPREGEEQTVILYDLSSLDSYLPR